MERELIVERTRAGLDAARAEGRIGGRRPKYQEETWQQMRRLLENGIPRKQVAIIYDVAVSTLYKKFPRRHFNPKPWFKRTRYQW
ncbi:putative DNA-invertase from lambdoid prophage e14 [Escherichia coli]|nr:putative DNA-invertase from lambdoid prophage e14 [Escherichia coli]